jgi:hypothetical protein
MDFVRTVMDTDYKLAKMMNNVLYNKMYGMKKPFDKRKYFLIKQFEQMQRCNSCQLNSDDIDNLLIKLVHEN